MDLGYWADRLGPLRLGRLLQDPIFSCYGAVYHGARSGIIVLLTLREEGGGTT